MFKQIFLLINTKPKGVISELTLGVHEHSAIQHVCIFFWKNIDLHPKLQIVVP